jgi:hypothetical protein
MHPLDAAFLGLVVGASLLAALGEHQQTQAVYREKVAARVQRWCAVRG